MKKLVGITAGLLITVYLFAQPSQASWKDVNYAGDTMAYHNLDIYLPAIEKPSYPVVIVIYGSAWFGNSFKDMAMQTLGKPLLDAGFAVATPNHRSSKDALFPAQIHDIKAVVRFVRARAAQYHLDTTAIGITGFSSGGHLAALAGTSVGVKQFTIGNATADISGSVGQHAAYSDKVHAVVDWFGPTDVLVLDSCRNPMLHNDADSPESMLIGGPVQQNRDKASLVNPVVYVDKSDPPFLILHGDKDPLVPPCQSELLHAALQKAKVSSQLVIVPGGQHGPGLFEATYYQMMTDFFKKELTGKNKTGR